MSGEMYDECKEQGILSKELVLRGEIEWVMRLGGVA